MRNSGTRPLVVRCRGAHRFRQGFVAQDLEQHRTDIPDTVWPGATANPTRRAQCLYHLTQSTHGRWLWWRWRLIVTSLAPAPATVSAATAGRASLGANRGTAAMLPATPGCHRLTHGRDAWRTAPFTMTLNPQVNSSTVNSLIHGLGAGIPDAGVDSWGLYQGLLAVDKLAKRFAVLCMCIA